MFNVSESCQTEIFKIFKDNLSRKNDMAFFVFFYTHFPFHRLQLHKAYIESFLRDLRSTFLVERYDLSIE